MATCPVCTNTTLGHTILVEGLPAYSCSRCNGVLLSLVAYRHWRETHPPEANAGSAPGVETHDTGGAKKCPRCSTLMLKYRMLSSTDNRLDYCPGCDDIWLDSGEWQLAEGLARSGDLAKTITQPWQRKLREEAAEAAVADRLKAKLGADYGKVADFKTWVQGHKHKAEVIAYLQSDQ